MQCFNEESATALSIDTVKSEKSQSEARTVLSICSNSQLILLEKVQGQWQKMSAAIPLSDNAVSCLTIVD